MEALSTMEAFDGTLETCGSGTKGTSGPSSVKLCLVLFGQANSAFVHARGHVNEYVLKYSFFFIENE